MGPPFVDVRAAKSELREMMRAARREIAADPVDRQRRSGVIGDRLIAAIETAAAEGRRVAT